MVGDGGRALVLMAVIAAGARALQSDGASR
jgi:hypothetical protein